MVERERVGWEVLLEMESADHEERIMSKERIYAGILRMKEGQIRNQMFKFCGHYHGHFFFAQNVLRTFSGRWKPSESFAQHCLRAWKFCCRTLDGMKLSDK